MRDNERGRENNRKGMKNEKRQREGEVKTKKQKCHRGRMRK